MLESIKQCDTSHTLQTANQEDKTIKRNREESSYTAETTTWTRFKLIYNKKPKINPVDKAKETVEILDEENTKKDTARHQICILSSPILAYISISLCYYYS